MICNTSTALKKLIVQDTLVSLTRVNADDNISLTDIARVRNPDEPKDVVKNWLRNRATVEYLGLWEKINNASFKGVEFDSFRLQAGSNSFTLSPNKWIEATGAIGIKSTVGRGGGTYAHRDIAFEFPLPSLKPLSLNQKCFAMSVTSFPKVATTANSPSSPDMTRTD